MSTSPEPLPGTAEPTLDYRGLAIRVVAGVLLMMVVLGAIAVVFREPLELLSRRFVHSLGGPGVMLGFFLPDAFTVPIPNDAFSFFALVGGMRFWEIVAWATVGSLLGGHVSFGLGRWLGHTRRVADFLAQRGAEVHGLVRRYGVWALGLAAVTPIPYSVGCMAAGALHMPYGRFVAVSMLRLPRIALYLWLIKLGVVSVTG
ncbi:MAG: DedA family protein [Deltaproteobacteria bacterium]|nr:DedA family protein [Deltaproteobacteria bacterium]MCB9786268.1 DedA family protein [Deltaproteobacteria bacterium]